MIPGCLALPHLESPLHWGNPWVTELLRLTFVVPTEAGSLLGQPWVSVVPRAPVPRLLLGEGLVMSHPHNTANDGSFWHWFCGWQTFLFHLVTPRKQLLSFLSFLHCKATLTFSLKRILLGGALGGSKQEFPPSEPAFQGFHPQRPLSS